LAENAKVIEYEESRIQGGNRKNRVFADGFFFIGAILEVQKQVEDAK
jgi:hypothetical protein